MPSTVLASRPRIEDRPGKTLPRIFEPWCGEKSEIPEHSRPGPIPPN